MRVKVTEKLGLGGASDYIDGITRSKGKRPYNPEEKAIILLIAIKQALAMGVKHYDKAGNLLADPKGICEALLRDGEIMLGES